MNKVWLITGANSGFGRAIAEAAVAAGDIVVGAARRVEAMDDLVAAHPDQVEALRLDVTDAAADRRRRQGRPGRHGRIDVLVNNAGREPRRRDRGDHRRGTARPVRRARLRAGRADPGGAAGACAARRSGAIVQMSSMGGQMSFAGFSAYSGTKFALEGMSEALADEVGPLGIKVLIVEPGAFRTSLMGNASRQRRPVPGYEDKVGVTRGHGRARRRPAAGRPGEGRGPDHRRRWRPRRPRSACRSAATRSSAVLGHLDPVRAQVAAWEPRTRATAFDD